MRSQNIGRVMSTYLGCRHVTPAVLGVNCLGSQQVNKLHQRVSVARETQSPSVRLEQKVIRIGDKTYLVKNLKPKKKTPGPKPGQIKRMVDKEILLSMRDSVLSALPNLSMFHPEKPFLAPGDEIKKYLSNSPMYFAYANEMLSLKRLKKNKRNEILNGFELEADVILQDLISPMREYLQNGDETLLVMNPDLEPFWESLKPVLNDLTNAQCFEDDAAHPILRYAQSFQCIANYKGVPSFIIIKTKLNQIHFHSKKHKLELFAGAAAFNFDPRWPVQVQNFVLILAKSDGSPAVVHVFNKENSSAVWEECLMRFERFWSSRSKIPFIDVRMKARDVPPVEQQSKPNLCEPETNRKQSSAKTVENFVLNHEDVRDTSISGEVDQNTPKGCVYNQGENPETKIEEKGVSNETQEDENRLCNNKSTNPQVSYADPNPKDVQEGGLKSLWSFWKSK